MSVTTYDADTLAWVRENATGLCETSPCPGVLPPSPLALTSDASHAFVSDPENDRVAYMYLDAPRSRFTSSYLETVVGSTKDEAFVGGSVKVQMLTEARAATTLFELGETAPDDEARRQLMQQAAVKLYGIRSSIDGCFGGDGADDVMNDCYEATGIWNVTGALLDAISWDLMDGP